MQRETVWRPLGKPGLKMENIISANLAEIERREPGMIPDLRGGKALLFGSDYGGRHQTANHETYSFVVADAASVLEWNLLRKDVRAAFLVQPGATRPPEMAYKKINKDRARERALLPFLEAADSLRGLSLTVAVDKRIPSLSPDRLPESDIVWNPEVFDRVMRVVHFISLLVAGLSEPGQDVEWITDRDEIADSPERLRELDRILRHVSRTMYLSHDMGTLECKTNGEDPTMLLSDYLAVPDLVAGCFSDVLRKYGEEIRWSDTETVSTFRLGGLPDKAQKILKWHGQTQHPLKRLFCIISPDNGPHPFEVDWPRFGAPRELVASGN